MRVLYVLMLLCFAPFYSECQLVDNYDTCRTQLYYQTTGNTANRTYIEKARTVQDNGIINAGYTNQSGNRNALLVKLNINGETLWQKEYGDINNDEQFTDWRELPNRQILLGGIAKNRVTLQSVFFMLLLTPDGNIIWQKSYADIATTSNINNAKIYFDKSGQIFFAAQADSAIIYGMVTNSGVTWQRSINSNPQTKLVAAVAYYSQLLIATNSTDSGFNVSNFYYVNYYWTGNPKQIKYSIKLGGAHQNAHYKIHDYEQYGQYTYFSGIRSVNNAPYEVIRININQGYIRESLETILTPGVAIDSNTQTTINIYGDNVGFTAGRKNNRLHAIHLTGSEQGTTIVKKSSSYLLPDSIVLKGTLKTWDNGYVYFGAKELPGGNQTIIQLKSDSAAISPNCISRQNENFTVSSNLFPTDTVKYIYNILHGLTPFIYTASSNMVNIDTLTLCKEIKCPLVPASDSCLDSYQKLYNSYDPGSYSTGIQIINGRTFVSGIVTPMDYIPEYTSSFIAEMNKNGQIKNQKKYVVGIGSTSKLIKTQDNNLLLYGFTSDSLYYPSIFLAKIDTNLNVIWIKSLRLSTTPQYSSNQSIGELKQSSDGSYFIQYSDGITFGGTQLYLTKLDVNGNHLWSKVYRASYSIPANIISGSTLEVAGGHVYIMCRNAYNSYAASIFLKVTESNGNLVWCKKYSNVQDNLDLTRMLYMYNNELVMGGQFIDNNSALYQNILVKTNTDGNVINAFSYRQPTTNFSPNMQFMAGGNGNIFMHAVGYGTPPATNPYQINVAVNNNFDIISSKKRPSIFYNNARALAIGAGGRLYETGSYSLGYNYNSILYLIKFAADGAVGSCLKDTMILQKIIGPSITVTNITCIQSDSFFTLRNPIYRADQFFLATSKMVCASVPGCNFLDVTGSTTICNTLLTYTYNAVRNTGCSAPLQWTYDNSNTQVLLVTDSSITLRFLTAGNFLLKARFTSNCIPYIDSLLINVIGNGNAPVLNLGPDRVLCGGANLLLNARKGFSSYLWQDGSTDSTFNVTTPGFYYVKVTDSCGIISSDSITFSVDNIILFDLGPNSNICRSDSLLLQVPNGLNSYMWWPQVNTIQQGPAAIIVFPTINTWYYVSAVKPNGCLVKDSVQINIYSTPQINLGGDQNICSGDTLYLNAGVGFNNYLWSTGATTSSIAAFGVGEYSVTATDNNNCKIKDTLSILQILPLPITQLPKELSICKGQSLSIHAGTGFTNYLWNNGQSTESILVSSLGQYWATVTNTSGCKQTDTVSVNKEIAVPADFIKVKDLTICNYEKIIVNTINNYASYLWSNGSVVNSITLNNAGKYWVKVTDVNGCYGIDSFNLSVKECKIGIFFPNSFTPNTDGLNDTYKPKSLGRLKNYRMIIFNRYGEKVFENIDISRGWNGEHKGIKQDTGGFVWQCRYQFEGEAEQYKSGSLLLIR
ncbi:MAG: gliding motility-associated C-terminal domain-containing protein [Bacteroidia bacterium]|nr:gliding motility-associated C-terminal domain-containing protein [Bacteroidia bacterium]